MSIENMTNAEAIEMMHRCIAEVEGLRAQIAMLKPKADAYDNIAVILGLLPRASISMGEDFIWRLKQRVRELSPKTEKQS